jgi:hypothetical protein
MRYSTSAIIWIGVSFHIYAQSGDYRMGGRAMGMGNASSTVSDEWSAYHNVGALAGKDQKPSVCFAYQSLYAVEGLGKTAAGITWPHNKFCGTINFFRFGDVIFNETRMGIGFSHKIRFVSLGIQVNYLQYVIENFGNRGMIYFDAGGLAEIFPGLWIGAFIQNINQARISRWTGEKFPFVMNLGISYRPQDFLMFNIDIEKDSRYYPFLKAGLEYAIHDKVYLRTGIGTDPVRNFFGIGFKPNRFKIDYALSTQNHLGFSHEFSMCYFLIKIK